jgi:hypothetical protein
MSSDGHLRILAACFLVCAVLAFAGAAIQLNILLGMNVAAPLKAALLATNVPTWLVALGFTGAALALLRRRGYLLCLVTFVPHP